MQVYIFLFKYPVPVILQHYYRIWTPNDIKHPVLCSRSNSCLSLQSADVQDNFLSNFSELGQQDCLYFRHMSLKHFRSNAELWQINNLHVLHICSRCYNQISILRRSVCFWRKRFNYQIQIEYICRWIVWIKFERRLRYSKYILSYISCNIQHLHFHIFN